MTEKEQQYEYEIQLMVQMGMERKVAYKVYDHWRNREKKLRMGFWQYLIDHTVIQPNGYMGVQLYYRNQEDLWKRVEARKNGEFYRYDAIEKEIRAAKQWKISQKGWGIKHHRARWGKNWFKRVIASLYERVIQK